MLIFIYHKIVEKEVIGRSREQLIDYLKDKYSENLADIVDFSKDSIELIMREIFAKLIEDTSFEIQKEYQVFLNNNK